MRDWHSGEPPLYGPAQPWTIDHPSGRILVTSNLRTKHLPLDQDVSKLTAGRPRAGDAAYQLDMALHWINLINHVRMGFCRPKRPTGGTQTCLERRKKQHDQPCPHWVSLAQTRYGHGSRMQGEADIDTSAYLVRLQCDWPLRWPSIDKDQDQHGHIGIYGHAIAGESTPDGLWPCMQGTQTYTHGPR